MGALIHAGGNAGVHTATVEGSLVVSYNIIKYILTVHFGNHPFMVFTLVESLYPHRKPCICCVQHFLFYHNGPNSEAAQWSSVGERMNTLWYIQTVGCCLVIK